MNISPLSNSGAQYRPLDVNEPADDTKPVLPASDGIKESKPSLSDREINQATPCTSQPTTSVAEAEARQLLANPTPQFLREVLGSVDAELASIILQALTIPISQLKTWDLMNFVSLANSNIDKRLAVQSLIGQFIERNLSEIAERSDLLNCLNIALLRLKNYPEEDRPVPFLERLFSLIIAIENTSLRNLKQKLEQATDQTNQKKLYKQWITFLGDKHSQHINHLSDPSMGSKDDHYWKNWKAEEQRLLGEYIAIAQDSTLPGTRGEPFYGIVTNNLITYFSRAWGQATEQQKEYCIKLYAQNIAMHPQTVNQQLALIPEKFHERVLSKTYCIIEPGGAAHDTITRQLNTSFQKTKKAPPIPYDWASAYLFKYPDMFSDWLNYLPFDDSAKSVIRKVFFAPADQVSASDIHEFLNLKKTGLKSSNKKLFNDLGLLFLFIENSPDRFPGRLDFLKIITKQVICLPSCLPRNSPDLAYMKRLSSSVITAEKKTLEHFEQILETTDKTNTQYLFQQWSDLLQDKAEYRDFSSSSSSGFEFSEHHEYWKIWQKEQRKRLDELVIMARNSKVLGLQECWNAIGSSQFEKLEKLGLSLRMPHSPGNDPVVEVLTLIQHSHQKQYLQQYHETMTEKELVVIATRAVPDIASYIVHNTRSLSLEALAEIGRHHPQLILPMLKQGDFQHQDAVPALVRFASAFEPLAEAVLRGDYNQYLTPSWRGKLAAGFPRLSEQVWYEFCQRPNMGLSDEWLQALAHIACSHESIARAVLQHPITATDKFLLKKIACHHQSLISQALIDHLKGDQYMDDLSEIIEVHGISCVEAMLSESDKKELLDGYWLPGEECPELITAQTSDIAIFNAALAWRDRAEKMEASVWQSQSPADHKEFHTRWPYLREVARQNIPPHRHSHAGGNPPRTVEPRLRRDDDGMNLAAASLKSCFSTKSAEPEINLESALSLLNTGDWKRLTVSQITQICQFPSVAEKICFESQFQSLAEQLTDAQQFSIWCQFQNTAEKALQYKRLTAEQVCTLLGQFPALTHRYLDKLSICTSEQIARVYCHNKQLANVKNLLNSSHSQLVVIRNLFTAEQWFNIVSQHREVAELLFRPDFKNIQNQLTPDHIYQLALQNRQVLDAIVKQRETVVETTLLKPGQWLRLCEKHPESFSAIYQKMQGASAEYQQAFSVTSLQELRGNSTLFHNILTSVNDSDRQQLLAQPASQPVAEHNSQLPGRANADFYPFDHPLYERMSRRGCCAGYALDFVRYARKHRTPASYPQKVKESRYKSYSAQSHRITALQNSLFTPQAQLKDISLQKRESRMTGLDMASCMAALKKEREVVLYSGNHANALLLHNDDLFYFEPNTGVWRWRNFDQDKHLAQLTTTIEDTLLRTGAGQLKIKAALKLQSLGFPEKRKAEFDPSL